MSENNNYPWAFIKEVHHDLVLLFFFGTSLMNDYDRDSVIVKEMFILSSYNIICRNSLMALNMMIWQLKWDNYSYRKYQGAFCYNIMSFIV